MRPKIFIVDDSKTVRQQVSISLSRGSFEIIEAESAEHALAEIEKHQDLAMLIADVNMPGISGLDMLEKLRADKRFAQLPVVVLTTESSGEKIERAKKLSAKAWLVKPFEPTKLLAVVQKIVGVPVEQKAG